eukprot:9135840-Pyramimonas_sp.AAC.1
MGASPHTSGRTNRHTLHNAHDTLSSERVTSSQASHLSGGPTWHAWDGGTGYWQQGTTSYNVSQLS